MRLNVLFASICDDLIQGAKQVTIPPSFTVPVTDEEGFKLVKFVANGMNFQGRFRDSKLRVVTADGTFVALMERNRVIESNPTYNI